MTLLAEDMLPDTAIISLILKKQLKCGMLAEIFLVKNALQFEAALFLDGHYKPGPPIPRPVEIPVEALAYWLGVDPKVGLSKTEGAEVIRRVYEQNKVLGCSFTDKWENNP